MIQIIETGQKFLLDPNRQDLSLQVQLNVIPFAPRRSTRTLEQGTHNVTPLSNIFTTWLLNVISPTKGTLKKVLAAHIQAEAASPMASVNEQLAKPIEVIPIEPGTVIPLANRRRNGTIRTRRFIICKDDNPPSEEKAPSEPEREKILV